MSPDSLFSTAEDRERSADITDDAEQLDGKLSSQDKEDKLMHAVMEGDKDAVDDGRLLTDMFSQGISSFTPDLVYAHMVKNYQLARQRYGETILRELTGYDPDFIEKNVRVPEFQKELENRLKNRFQNLKEKHLLDKDGVITDDGLQLAALILYVEELDQLSPKGLGEQEKQETAHYGEKQDTIAFRKGRYRDIALKASVKKALRRNHTSLRAEDLLLYERKARGSIQVIYAVDASGSMRGEKLKTAKKAGVALAFKAIAEKNKVGVIVFGSTIKKALAPTLDFLHILRELATITASMETDIAATISKAQELFGPRSNQTKHLVLLTDALPTKGKDPRQLTLEAVSAARDAGITVSLIGINLTQEGEDLARQITAVGQGRLYVAADTGSLDSIILQDYQALKD